MTDDTLKFTTGDGEWDIVKASGRYAVCKFSNERMRITSDGVFFGASLRTVENSLETHWFNTWEFANAARRAFNKLDAIGENFGKTRITITTPGVGIGTGASYSFYQPQHSNWQCYLFGNTPGGGGMVYRPEVGKVPNAFVRWCMKVMLACTWVRDRA